MDASTVVGMRGGGWVMDYNALSILLLLLLLRSLARYVFVVMWVMWVRSVVFMWVLGPVM